MRRFTFLTTAAFVMLIGCSKSGAPSPGASGSSVPAADVPENERITWKGTQCEVRTVTARARAELQAHKPAVTGITFAHDATQQDIDALRDSKLHALHSVHILKSPKVKDLSPLATLHSLRQLEVTDTGVTSLAPLSKLPKLAILSFGTSADRSAPWPAEAPKKAGVPDAVDAGVITNEVVPGAAVEVDLGDIAHATSLKRLFLHGVTTKLDGLRGSTLTTLGLAQMHIDDPAPIAAMASLGDLNLSATSMPSVDWIGKLTKLHRLTVVNLRLDNLDFAAPLVDLTSLIASKNPRVTSLAPVSKLPKLTLLYVDGTSVEDLAPVAGLTSLTALSVSQTRVQSLAPLSAITTLTMVQAADTGVHDLAPLRASTKLTTVFAPKACTDADVDALKKAAPKVVVTR